MRSNVLKRFIKPKAEPYRFPTDDDLLETQAEGPSEVPNAEKAGEPVETWEPEAPDAVETEVSAKAAPSFETVFDYADIQVEAILADARRQAEEIKTSARISVEQELDALREQARQEGYQEGFSKGMADAVEQSKKEREQQALEQEARIGAFLEKASQEQDALLERSKDDMRDLAIAVAEKIVRVSLRSSGGVIAKMIQGATEKLKRREWVHIYIAGCDAPGLAKVTARLTPALSALSDHIRIVPMADEESGTCIVEMPDTIIDASASTQMANIKALLADIPADDTLRSGDLRRRISDL